MPFIYLLPLLPWQQDQNQSIVKLLLLIKIFQTVKYEENQWLCMATKFWIFAFNRDRNGFHLLYTSWTSDRTRNWFCLTNVHENIESKLFVIVEYPWLIASFPFKRRNHLWVFDNDFLSAYSKYKFLCFKMQKKNPTKPGNQKLKENGF